MGIAVDQFGVLDRRVLLIVAPTFGPASGENVASVIGFAIFLKITQAIGG